MSLVDYFRRMEKFILRVGDTCDVVVHQISGMPQYTYNVVFLLWCPSILILASSDVASSPSILCNERVTCESAKVLI